MKATSGVTTRRTLARVIARSLALDGVAVQTRAGMAEAADAGGDFLLLRTCREFDRLEHLLQGIRSSGTTLADAACEAEVASIERIQEPVFDGIVTTPAATLAGVRAKAASLALWNRDAAEEPSECWDVLLVRSLVADLLRMVPG